MQLNSENSTCDNTQKCKISSQVCLILCACSHRDNMRSQKCQMKEGKEEDFSASGGSKR